MENNAALKKAERTVNAKLIFLLHLATYAIVNALLLIINLMTSPQYFWFIWPLLGWGVGLCFHAVIYFVFFGRSSLKDQMLKKEIENTKK